MLVVPLLQRKGLAGGAHDEDKADEVAERGVCDFTEPEAGQGHARGQGCSGMGKADVRLVDNGQGQAVVESGSMTVSEVSDDDAGMEHAFRGRYGHAVRRGRGYSRPL